MHRGQQPRLKPLHASPSPNPVMAQHRDRPSGNWNRATYQRDSCPPGLVLLRLSWDESPVSGRGWQGWRDQAPHLFIQPHFITQIQRTIRCQRPLYNLSLIVAALGISMCDAHVLCFHRRAIGCPLLQPPHCLLESSQNQVLVKCSVGGHLLVATSRHHTYLQWAEELGSGAY